MMPDLPTRTLRCANGALYIVMALGVVGACIWSIAAGRLVAGWQVGAAVAGALGACLWAGYYAALAWEISAAGVYRRFLWRRRLYTWQSLQHAELRESEDKGVAMCAIELDFAEGKVTLSSELLPLDEIQALRDELVARGLLSSSRATSRE